MIEVEKTKENSEVSGREGLLIAERLIQLFVVVMLLFLAADIIRNFAGALSIYFSAPSLMHMPYPRQNELISHIAWGAGELAFLALLIWRKVIYATFAYGGAENYEIGYSTILNEPTTSITTWRIALQLWPIYIWKTYAVERREGKTTLENVTTADDSTVAVTIYFAWMPWIIRAAIMRGIRELSPLEITNSFKGLINLHVPGVVRSHTSSTLIGDPTLITKGVLEKIGVGLTPEQIEKESRVLNAGGGQIVNYPVGAVLRRASAEIMRNPAEIKAAGIKFEQDRTNERRASNAENLDKTMDLLSKKFGGDNEKALNAILLTEKNPAAQKIIIEGGDPAIATIGKYLVGGKKNP